MSETVDGAQLLLSEESVKELSPITRIEGVDEID